MNDTVAVLQGNAPGAAQATRSEAEPPAITPASTPGHGRRHLLRALAAVVLATVLLGYVFPHVVGTTVSGLRDAFGAVSGREALVLTALWAGGLLTHSFVLTGALPGLTRRRALTLNLTGSAVANTLPFGGAAGMSMNYVMITAWGVEAAGFAAFTLVTNVWVVLLKLVMPGLAVAALWASGGPVSGATGWTAAVSLAALVVVAGVGIVALASRRTAERVIGALAPAVDRLSRIARRRSDPIRLAAAVLGTRDAVAAVMRRRWGQMSLGMVGYGLFQAVLLWACLHAVGAALAPAVVLAGYAVDRVMTLAVITPGAAGFAEAGTAAALIALGGPAAPVAAGVLLYRGFTFALEIPVGGAWLAGWLLHRRRATAGRRAG